MAKKKKKPSAKTLDKAGMSSGQESKKLSRKDYENELFKLHAELVKLQEWVKSTGYRTIILFEGRDAAGKGGAIKAITERVSPRVFRVVALPAPSERQKTQMYIQRYIEHFPAAGEIVLFDRSWYNRAGVERVMGFCTEAQYEGFVKWLPKFEQAIIESGVKLIKYWFHVSMEEQERRFRSRIDDPRKVWKLSPMDVESYKRWYEYSRARDAMFEISDTKTSPWYIVNSDNKRRARLNCISHLLSLIPYEKIPRENVKLGKRTLREAYDDRAVIQDRNFVPERY